MTVSSPVPSTSDLLQAADAWIGADPDPGTRAAMAEVIARADPVELAELLGRRIEFGTAGLRAALGPGPNRMNRLVVRQAAAGLARHLLEAVPDCRRRGVVVGRDARHGSAEFAHDVVEVVASHGIDVHEFALPVPTPLAAFALRHLGAAAAVVVTASHNPAADNGMKVYWADGAQIVTPVDAEIAASIAAVVTDGHILPEATPTPVGGPDDDTDAGRTGTVHQRGGPASDDPIVLAYVAEAVGLAAGPPAASITIASTSMHGVGAELLDRVLHAGGHSRVRVVEAQRDPDPDFPTVRFPNPEEPGALDRLFALARQIRADVAIANDPDADRMAIAAVDRSGGWRALSGDETGALLAHRLLELSPPGRELLLATTVVSSRLVARMAEAAGARFSETLTGFKWLCRPGIAHPDWYQVLLYEEALGYAIGPHARDKDGIVAALVAADLVATLVAQRRTVWDVLDDLAAAHGAHVQRNGSVRLSGPGWQNRLSVLVEQLVERPPSSLGGQDVVRADRPAVDVLRLHLADDTRVVIRPSGTEPKLKYYCEAIEPVLAGATAARAIAGVRLAAVVDQLRTILTV